MFAAIIFLMTFTPIGFIPLGAMNATIIHVPVIIGSLILGPSIGAVLGCLFGFASLIRATISPTLLSFVFSPLIPIPGTDHGSAWALVICLVPRILVGVFPFYIDKFLSGFAKENSVWKFISTFIAGILGSMTNTLLVMGLISILFKDAYALAVNIPAETVQSAVLAIIMIHGIPEAIVAGIFASAVAKAVRAFKKSGSRG
jgi:uncharacterized membrane protein